MSEKTIICIHCGGYLLKVSEDPEDMRYRHVDTGDYICDLPPDCNGWYANARPKPKKEEAVTDQPKYKKISIIVDDGETTHIQTFYRTKEFSYGMENLDPDMSRDVMVYGISFKAERDEEKDCVSTSESFVSNDGEIYIRRGGIMRKLGL